MELIDKLLDEWEEKCERGESLTPEELCAQHPELVDEVRKQIRALQAVEEAFGTSRLFGDDEPPEKWEVVPPEFVELPSRYQIEKLHATGGLGNIYLARDRILNRPVAIKFPKRAGMSKEQLARFQREAIITGQLEHPGIVPILALDATKSTEPCYVMRFINGKTLQESVQARLEFRSPLEVESYFRSEELRHLLQSFVALCNIVAYAHGQGVIHRDIKPSNVMLGPFGETLLLDWGIAKQLKPTRSTSELEPAKEVPVHLEVAIDTEIPNYTATGQSLGTPAYGSPEQLFGQADASQEASDIFSLGATLFFIASGKSPIDMTGWEYYLQLCRTPDSDLSRLLPNHVPAGLRAICRKGMRIPAGERYASALQMASDVDRFLAREPISVYRDPLSVRLGRMARKRPALVSGSIATVIVVAIASLIASILFQSKNQELAVGNKKLETALGHAERANQLGLESIRSVFDDVVVLKFQEKTSLSDQEFRFLDKALDQFKALSENQGSSEQSRAIRAESHSRMATILERLSKDEECEKHLIDAVEEYEKLFADFKRNDYRVPLIDSLRRLASVRVSHGKTDESLEVAQRGLELTDEVGSTHTDESSYHRLFNRAVFRAILGSSLEARTGNSQAAVDGQREAIRLLEQCLQENPEFSGAILNQLVGCNIALGHAIGKLPNSSDWTVARREAVGNAVCYAYRLRPALASSPVYGAQLAEALLAEAVVLDEQGSDLPSLKTVKEAIPIIDEIVSQYPLFEDYSYILSQLLLLEAKLRVESKMDVPQTLSVLEKALALPIKIAELHSGVETLTQLLGSDRESEHARMLLVTFKRMRAIYFERHTNDIPSARADCLSSLELVRSMSESPDTAEQIRREKLILYLMNCRLCFSQKDLRGAKASYEAATTAYESYLQLVPDAEEVFGALLKEHRQYVTDPDDNQKVAPNSAEVEEVRIY